MSAEAVARRLGISRAAADLFLQSDVIDLHVESYSFYRAFGYDITKRHGPGLHRGLLVGQADLPRLIDTGLGGATWVISGNPLRPKEDRAASFRLMLSELSTLLTKSGHRARVVRSKREYQEARAAGEFACFLGVQGANALPSDPGSLREFSDELLRITLLHLTPSAFGRTSAPLSPKGGLTDLGRDFIFEMNRLKVGVDLAHISKRGFWEAVRASDPSVPLLVTHTGVSEMHQHWRNLDDSQLRAIAERGGVVGIMYHSVYLGDPLLAGRLSSVVRHIKHALKVVGPDHVSLGSDWDGAICTPRDMPTCEELPRLVEALLQAGVGETAIQKLLGANFLRVVEDLRGA